MFRVGQKVVCIGGAGSPHVDWDAWVAYWKISLPSRGQIYTVRDTREGRIVRQIIRVIEIVNPIVEFGDAPGQEPWWRATYFRPIVERKTDISILTRMLREEEIV